MRPAEMFALFLGVHGAHGVVVSHPLSMREALGSIPSVSIAHLLSESICHREIGHVPLCGSKSVKMTLAGLEPAIFGSEDQRLIH